MKNEPTGGQPSAVELRPVTFSAWRSRAAWGLFLLFVFGYYWYFISAGRITSWPDWGGGFYDSQAEGFRAGHLHTILKPNPRLLRLPDPYAYENRDLWAWDYSLYGGRLYLYWGLTPAALLALVKSLLRIDGAVQDSVIVFTFLCLRVLGGSLLIVALARRFTPAPPRWALWSALLVFALAHPTPFLLARPAIYEAALTGGACFIVWAYYFALRWLAEGRVTAQLRWLAAGSACLGLAGTTRPSLLPAAALFSVLLFVSALAQLSVPLWQRLTWRRSRAAAAEAELGAPRARGWRVTASPWWALLRCGAAAFLPFSALTLAHLVVNHVRFGSWREFGVSYQLGIPFDIAPRYVLANAFNYLFHPWHSSCRFPFLLPRWHETWPLQYHLPSWIEVPEGYYAYEPLTGVVNAVPFCWLLLSLPLGLLWARWRRRLASTGPAPQDGAERRSGWRWFKAIVILVTLVSTVPVLMLFAFTMRYEAEFASGVLLLSCLAGWRWLSLPQRPVGRRLAGVAYGGIALLTLVVGAPFGFTGYYDSFYRHNPDLFARLQAALSTCPASEGGCPTMRGCGP